MKNIMYFILLFNISGLVIAGGNNEFVAFPDGYKDSFTHYNTQNRANNKQIADMYANQIAIESIKSGSLADGSRIVMEVYLPETNEDGKPVTGPDGLFIKSKLAAIAVMEKKSDWDNAFSADDRAGNWGFALYTPDGTPKKNDLDCVTCHRPLSNQDYMFTHQKLLEK